MEVNKKELKEQEIRTLFITPALQQKGKDKNCNGENPELIHMDANEFFEFKRQPENADRRFFGWEIKIYIPMT